MCPKHDSKFCVACDDSTKYKLNGITAKCDPICTCKFGLPINAGNYSACAEPKEACSSCHDGYHLDKPWSLDSRVCTLNECKCSPLVHNGTSFEKGRGTKGVSCPVHDTEFCATCTKEKFLPRPHGICEAVCTCNHGRQATGAACVMPGEICVKCMEPKWRLLIQGMTYPYMIGGAVTKSGNFVVKDPKSAILTPYIGDAKCHPVCTCEHGAPVPVGVPLCDKPKEVCNNCTQGFWLDDATSGGDHKCKPQVCTCAHGAVGRCLMCPRHKEAQCFLRCDHSFHLTAIKKGDNKALAPPRVEARCTRYYYYLRQLFYRSISMGHGPRWCGRCLRGAWASDPLLRCHAFIHSCITVHR